MNNRLWNVKNPNQGSFKKVLCLCSAGLLRSPTTAFVLSQPPYNYNTRAAGVDVGHALIPLDEVLINWADEIVVMEPYQKQRVVEQYDVSHLDVHVLNVPDRFKYRDPRLIEYIKASYNEVSGFVEPLEVNKEVSANTAS